MNINNKLLDVLNHWDFCAPHSSFPYMLTYDYPVLEEDYCFCSEKKCSDGIIYIKVHSNGLVSYGLEHDDGKWWSSRAEVINEYFHNELIQNFGCLLHEKDIAVSQKSKGGFISIGILQSIFIKIDLFCTRYS